MAFVERLRSIREAASVSSLHPWTDKLSKIKGRFYPDGIERIGTQELFDVLDVPIAQRQGQARPLTEIMIKLGWTAVRFRALTRAGFRDRIRGFARPTPSASPPRAVSVRS